MKLKLLSMTALFVALRLTPAQANDTVATGVGGRWEMMEKEHPSIRMVSEKVDITISHDSYDTVAHFVFRNDGPATTVKMGFPESSYGDIDSERYKRHSSFTKFSTSVDGKIFKAYRRVTDSDQEDVNALWIKTVPFRARQTRRVRVSYKSSLCGIADIPGTFVRYQFTGANWRGNVESSVLAIHFSTPGTYLFSPDTGKVKPQFRRIGRTFIYTWKNWQAQDDFELVFGTTLRGWLSENGTGPTEATFITDIDIPSKARSEKYVDWAPPGVIRSGKLYVSLQDWVDWAATKRKLQYRYDVKSHAIVVQDGTRSVAFSTLAKGENLPVRSAWRDGTLYVPAERLTKEFGAAFGVRPKDHVLKFR